jgi:hypothetical protein
MRADDRRAAAMIFLVMAPFGPLYFLEKHRRQPAILNRTSRSAIVRRDPLPRLARPGRRTGAFFDRSKAQLRAAQRAMRERNAPGACRSFQPVRDRTSGTAGLALVVAADRFEIDAK